MDNADADDEFQDAYESQPVVSSMDLQTSVDEAKIAVHYFFNNKFSEAKEILLPWTDSSMYHSLGNGVFAFLEAILTFEQQHIEAASEALKQCITVCNRYRRRNTISESLGKMVKKPNYDLYSPGEIHAELCYAEALLLKSMLTFVEDETLISFIKAGIKIRSCFNSYKECKNILNQRNWGDESHKVHFESGVRMGIGTFNLEVGLRELETGYRLHHSIRQILCVMSLLGYHLMVVYSVSHSEGDLQICDEILRNQLQLYPQGVWFLFFKGRLEFMKGNIDDSINWYIKSWKSQNIFPQYHHICFWELMWTNSMKQEWREASMYANRLLQESRWSRTIYSYQRAALLCMLGNDLSLDEETEIHDLMRDAPQWKQRIAGKSLPMEKFVVKKTERFFAQKKMLVLPAVELLYVWNLFKILGKKRELIQNMYKIIEKALAKLDAHKKHREFDADNHALLLLLKGASLRQMQSPLQAEECLNTVLSLEKKIKEDLYLIPYTLVELALLFWDQGNTAKTLQLLEDAKKNYTGYSLESRLHFKIHSLQTALSEGKKMSSDGTVNESTSL